MPKIPFAEKSPYQNIPALKRPYAGTSAALNGARAKMFQWCNIRVQMTLAKMFCAEMVGRRKIFWMNDPHDFNKKYIARKKIFHNLFLPTLYTSTILPSLFSSNAYIVCIQSFPPANKQRGQSQIPK